jgi:hypothetical protein
MVCTWGEEGDMASAHLAFSREAASSQQPARPVSLGAGNSFGILLEASGATADGVREIEVAWNDASSPRPAKWRIGPDERNVRVAVADASCIEENGFFHVPFHHEIIFRGDAAKPVDVSVTASQPCRVEIYDEHSDGALAIDANGDGAFDGKGDIFEVDRDADGFPDVIPPDGQKMTGLEIWVYPFSAPGHDAAADIEVSVFTRDGADWELQAVDTLQRTRP